MTKHDGQQRGNDHFSQRRFGHDIDAGAVFRYIFAAQNSGFRGQLPAHFAHDRARGFAHRIHAESGEDKWQQSADEQTDDHFRFVERKLEEVSGDPAGR